ncbi:MAG: DUF6318 family protein [Kineosporiaceae bacterium]
MELEQPSSTFPPLPTAPAAAQKNTPEGAEEFAKHFLDILQYGYRYSDPLPMRSVALPGCRFCSSTAEEMRQQKEKGQKLVGGDIKVRAVLARADGPKDRVVIDGSFEETASKLVDAQGRTVTEYSASDAEFLTIALKWDAVAGWKVLGASIKETK